MTNKKQLRNLILAKKYSKEVVKTSISQKIEMEHRNQIENIKKEKNRESKMKQIGTLIMDLG